MADGNSALAAAEVIVKVCNALKMEGKGALQGEPEDAGQEGEDEEEEGEKQEDQ